jgi:hypothetical protein
MPQSQAPAQLTNIPPTPSCNPAAIFGDSRDCQDRWNIYNQAVQQRRQEELQLYVSRQKELASAPLQQQISDLNKLVGDQQSQITKLHEQIQSDVRAAMQAKASAHTEGLENGTGIGVGGALLLFAVFFGIKRVMNNFTVTKKPQAQAAIAGK